MDKTIERKAISTLLNQYKEDLDIFKKEETKPKEKRKILNKISKENNEILVDLMLFNKEKNENYIKVYKSLTSLSLSTYIAIACLVVLCILFWIQKKPGTINFFILLIALIISSYILTKRSKTTLQDFLESLITTNENWCKK
ncbi:hypothetical protein [Floccifex sp.]|uniref:hypothetical protein n=1 Tax=Floccifex sp. TaxID=2815810 RepID=UPI003F11634B